MDGIIVSMGIDLTTFVFEVQLLSHPWEIALFPVIDHKHNPQLMRNRQQYAFRYDYKCLVCTGPNKARQGLLTSL